MPHTSSDSSNSSAQLPQSSVQRVTTRLLRLPSVLEKVPVSKTEWYRRVKSGAAPQSVQLGPRAVAWRESDIEGYIAALSRVSSK
jgi:prophage regulatory protein